MNNRSASKGFKKQRLWSVDLGVSCYGGWGETWKVRNTEIAALKNDELYYLLSPSVLEKNHCVDVTPIEKEVYVSKKAKSKLLPLGTYNWR